MNPRIFDRRRLTVPCARCGAQPNRDFVIGRRINWYVCRGCGARGATDVTWTLAAKWWNEDQEAAMRRHKEDRP